MLQHLVIYHVISTSKMLFLIF